MERLRFIDWLCPSLNAIRSHPSIHTHTRQRQHFHVSYLPLPPRDRARLANCISEHVMPFRSLSPLKCAVNMKHVSEYSTHQWESGHANADAMHSWFRMTHHLPPSGYILHHIWSSSPSYMRASTSRPIEHVSNRRGMERNGSECWILQLAHKQANDNPGLNMHECLDTNCWDNECSHVHILFLSPLSLSQTLCLWLSLPRK